MNFANWKKYFEINANHFSFRTAGYKFNQFFSGTMSIVFEAEEIVKSEKRLTRKFLVPAT
jgi:hypothetical protein